MSFADWLYPPVCIACGQILPIQEKEWRRFRLCAGCHALFEKIKPPVCERCGHPLEEDEVRGGTGTKAGGCPSCFSRSYAFESNRSFFSYDGVLRDILLDIKFHSRRQSAVGLGELWASVLTAGDLAAVGFSSAGGILAPVPMHPGKVRSRGFDQAEILAAAVAKKIGAQMKKDLLKRTANTPPQSGLTARGRAENVRGAFKLNGRCNVGGKKIVLIDDIFTTGASLNACAEVLLREGAGGVACMTLAIAVKNGDKPSDL